MNYRVIRCLLLASLATACADVPNAPSPAVGFEPVLVVSDPPPPPADGREIGETCVPDPDPCPPAPIRIPFLGVKYLRAPGSDVAFVSFTSLKPDEVVVSPNARVRDIGHGVVGSGTITATVLLSAGDPSTSARIIVDLTTATGSLDATTGSIRMFQFTAEATFAATGLPVGIPVLFWYEF